MKASLVELVENDATHARERWIVDKFPQQDAFGNKADDGISRHDGVISNLIADPVTHSLSQFVGDSSRQGPGGNSSGLKDQEFPTIQHSFLEQDLGHLRRFAGSRRGTENDSIPFSVGIDEFVFNFPDWQIHEAPLQQMFGNILAKSENERHVGINPLAKDRVNRHSHRFSPSEGRPFQ